MTAPYQLVTLVTEGGVPAQLVDQFGAPFATTGTGPLVFANGPTLNAPIFTGTLTLDNLTVTGDTILNTVSAGSLAVAGNITGTWQGTAIAAQYGGTGLAAYTAGDLIYASGATTLAKLPIGSEGQVLTVSGGVPVWAADLSGVTSFSAGTTGLTPSTPSGGAVVLGGTLNLTSGGTGANLSATGGTSQVLRQSTLGGAVTVSQLAASDLSNGTTGSGGVVLASGAAIGGATLTTTVINGSLNTITNIANASLSNSSITINGSNVSLGGTITISAAASSITMGSTTVVGATDGYILYNNAGTLAAVGSTGTGDVVRATNAVLATPNLGTPSAVNLSNGTNLSLATGVTGNLPVTNLNSGTGASGSTFWRGDGTWAAPAAALIVGTSSIASGTDTRVLYDNAGVLGEYTISGSGSVAMTVSPAFTTPNLGTPSAVNLSNGTQLPISTGVSGLGTGVATALAVNVGSSGAFVTNGGALGAPSSGDLTNCSGFPGATAGSGTTFLGSDVAFGTSTTFQNIVNTGSIGANGQVWLLIGVATFANAQASGNANIELAIYNGSAYVDNSPTYLYNQEVKLMTIAVVVTLTAATTFTLRARCNSGVTGTVVQTTGLATGVSNKATGLTAVRIA